MLMAQISDLHIKAERRKAYGRVDTATMLEACVAQLNAHTPVLDAVLATGDLTDHGTAGDFALLNELLAPLKAPLWLMPGNHDDRRVLVDTFGDAHPYLRAAQAQWPDGFVQYRTDIGPLRVLALDTVVHGQSHGLLCDTRLHWLDAELTAAADRPVMLALHHAPFATGIGHMDGIGLHNAAAFEAVLRRHPPVHRIVCGHLHRPIQALFGGTLAMTCPSPAHQVALDFRADGPDNYTMEPPGYLLHGWIGGRLVTHQAVIGQFDGPYFFREDGALLD